MMSKELKKLKTAIQYQSKPKKKLTNADKQDKILWNWIKENYGGRCQRFNDACSTCQAWRMYEYLRLNGMEVRRYSPYWIDAKIRTRKTTIKL